MQEKLNKVKGYRVMAGLTQECMAELLEMSDKSYRVKEKDQTFKIEELIKIKNILKSKGIDVTIDELVS